MKKATDCLKNTSDYLLCLFGSNEMKANSDKCHLVVLMK